MRASWTVDEAQKIVSRSSPERLTCWRPLRDRVIAGDGVDLATGHVLFEEQDGLLPGPPSIALRRTYCSGLAHRPSILGPGWWLSLDQKVEREPSGLVWYDAEGRELVFDHTGGGELASGLVLRHRLLPYELRVLAPGLYRVEAEGCRFAFEALSGAGTQGPAVLRSIEQGTASAWLAHDGEGRPLEVRAGALRLTLAYAQDRLQIVRLVLPEGSSIDLASYDYDSAGHLSACRSPHGLERRYELACGLLVGRTRRDGTSTYFGYDDIGSLARCMRTWSEGGYDDRKLSYRRGATTVIDSAGATQVLAFDPLGRPLSLPQGKVSYHATMLVPERVVGPMGTRQASLDERGCITAVAEPDGTTTRYTLDAQGRVIARVEGAGPRTEVRYGADGSVVERVEDAWRTIVRDGEGGAQEVVVGDEWLEVRRDAARRVSRVALREEVWACEHDVLGRPARLTSPDGERRFEHDALGRVTAIIVDGSRAGFDWDGEGRLRSARTPEGTWSIERDAAGLPVAVDRPGLSCELRYDRERRLVEVRDPRGRRWRFERDRAGRVTHEHDFDGRVHRYAYAGASPLVAAVTLPNSEQLRAVRDARGRVVKVLHPSGLAERFAYDAAGRLIEATRGLARVVLHRDARGAVIGEQQGDDEVGARRDARGRRSLVVSSLGARVSRVFGAQGERLLEVMAPDGSRHEVRLHARSLAAGRLQVPRVEDTPPMRASSEGEIERDEVGRVSAWGAPDGRRFEYGYSADGLLEKVALPNGDTWTYELDAFGRRTHAASARWDARWIWDGGVVLHEVTSYAPPALYVFDPADGSSIGKIQPGAVRWLGMYRDFVALFDPMHPEQPTTDYWPWRGGLALDLPTGLWLGPGRAFHPRVAEPMGATSLVDELFGPTERRPFRYVPCASALLDRASEMALAHFVERLTTPPWLALPRTPPVPWPEPIEAPRLIPHPLRV